MISEFAVYLRLGFEHILDPRGYDHILFVVALTALYVPRAWRQVVVLVTAFTVGHSVTLALATVGRVRISTEAVEFLIPVTILATALLNLAEVRWSRRHSGAPEARTPSRAGSLLPAPETRDGPRGRVNGWDDALEPAAARRAKYGLALVFGLVHGLGFSNFLRAALGAEPSITGPLFAFNVGLELAQILVVAVVLAGAALITGPLAISRARWVTVLSAAAAAVSLYLLAGRIPF